MPDRAVRLEIRSQVASRRRTSHRGNRKRPLTCACVGVVTQEDHVAAQPPGGAIRRDERVAKCRRERRPTTERRARAAKLPVGAVPVDALVGRVEQLAGLRLPRRELYRQWHRILKLGEDDRGRKARADDRLYQGQVEGVDVDLQEGKASRHAILWCECYTRDEAA